MLRRGHAFVLFVVVALLFGSLTATVAVADLIPYNTYLTSNWSDIHSKLDGKTGVTAATNPLISQPWGVISFQVDCSLVPAGTQLWIIAANDRQVVGELDMTLTGTYNFADTGTFGIYGDRPSTPGVDEGAAGLEPLIVAAEINDVYYQGSFVSGDIYNFGGYVNATGNENDIKITNTVLGPVPEPATLFLLGTGIVGFVGWRVRRRMK